MKLGRNLIAFFQGAAFAIFWLMVALVVYATYNHEGAEAAFVLVVMSWLAFGIGKERERRRQSAKQDRLLGRITGEVEDYIMAIDSATKINPPDHLSTSDTATWRSGQAVALTHVMDSYRALRQARSMQRG